MNIDDQNSVVAYIVLAIIVLDKIWIKLRYWWKHRNLFEEVQLLNHRILEELKELQRLTKAKRAYLFKFHNGQTDHPLKLSVTHEVTAYNISPMESHTQSRAASHYTALIENIKNGPWIVRTEDLTDPKLRGELVFRDAEGFAGTILRQGHQPIGILCLDFGGIHSPQPGLHHHLLKAALDLGPLLSRQ